MNEVYSYVPLRQLLWFFGY